jgi:hypothetical protein
MATIFGNDTPEALPHICGCYATALRHILEPWEGIVVRSEAPLAGKFIVYHDPNIETISIIDVSETDYEVGSGIFVVEKESIQ